MKYLISYDITEDRLRTRLAKYLRQQGCQRLQKSVFLSPNYPPKAWKQVALGLKTLAHNKLSPTDSILCFALNQQDLEKAIILGNEEWFQKARMERLFFIV